MTQIMSFQILDIKNQTFFLSTSVPCIIWSAGQDLSPTSMLMQDTSLGHSRLTLFRF